MKISVVSRKQMGTGIPALTNCNWNWVNVQEEISRL